MEVATKPNPKKFMVLPFSMSLFFSTVFLLNSVTTLGQYEAVMDCNEIYHLGSDFEIDSIQELTVTECSDIVPQYLVDKAIMLEIDGNALERINFCEAQLLKQLYIVGEINNSPLCIENLKLISFTLNQKSTRLLETNFPELKLLELTIEDSTMIDSLIVHSSNFSNPLYLLLNGQIDLCSITPLFDQMNIKGLAVWPNQFISSLPENWISDSTEFLNLRINWSCAEKVTWRNQFPNLEELVITSEHLDFNEENFNNFYGVKHLTILLDPPPGREISEKEISTLKIKAYNFGIKIGGEVRVCRAPVCGPANYR